MLALNGYPHDGSAPISAYARMPARRSPYVGPPAPQDMPAAAAAARPLARPMCGRGWRPLKGYRIPPPFFFVRACAIAYVAPARAARRASCGRGRRSCAGGEMALWTRAGASEPSTRRTWQRTLHTTALWGRTRGSARCRRRRRGGGGGVIFGDLDKWRAIIACLADHNADVEGRRREKTRRKDLPPRQTRSKQYRGSITGLEAAGSIKTPVGSRILDRTRQDAQARAPVGNRAVGARGAHAAGADAGRAPRLGLGERNARICVVPRGERAARAHGRVLARRRVPEPLGPDATL